MSWTESHTVSDGKHSRTETRHYSANEKFFDQTIPVYGEGACLIENRLFDIMPYHALFLHAGVDEGSSLPQGNHVFPFNFQLPLSLPTSYEGMK